MPADDPPPTSLVALRDRRERVIANMTENFAADVLDLDEFEVRVDAAHGATTIVALDRLVADLAPLPETGVAAPATALVVHDDPDRPARESMTAVFGGLDRRGGWLVPRRLHARVGWRAAGSTSGTPTSVRASPSFTCRA